MGIIDSKSNNQQLNELLKKYKIVKTIPEREIIYLEDLDQKGQDCLSRSIPYNGDNNNAQRNMLNEKKKVLDNPHVTKLKEFTRTEIDHYCGVHQKIQILFEYPHRTLNQEIVERSTLKSKFTEKELWSIIASCILGMSHLQKNNIRHEAITSQNILVDSNGVIKVADPFCTEEPSNYSKMISKNRNQHIYLSPELCKCLDEAEVVPTHDVNPYKSDVFSFGMVMMEAALLKYLDDCYREQNTKINKQTVEYYLDQIEQVYNTELKQMISQLVSDVSKRPDWLELKQYMKDNKEGSAPTEKSNLYGQPQVVPVHPRPVVLGDKFYNQHNDAVNYGRPVSYLPQPQSNIVYKEVVGAIKPQVISNQPLNYSNPVVTPSGSSSIVGGSQHYGADIIPVQPCNINLIRPALGTRPADSYITHTKIDQNLVQVSDDEDDLQTNESQYNRLHQNNNSNFAPQPYQNNSNATTNYSQKTFVSPQIDPRYRYQNPAPVYTQNPITTTSVYSVSQGAPIVRPGSQFLPNPGSVRYVSNIPPSVGLPHHNSAYNRPISVQTSAPNSGNFKTIDTASLFTDYEKLGIKKNNPTSFVSPTSQSYYSKTDIPLNARPVSQHQNNKVGLPPVQNVPAQTKKFVVQTFNQGSRYEGEKVAGLRHGKGKFYYQDGGLYDGDWKENKMCGKGKLFYQSGKIAYDGDWENDQFTGYGVLYNEHPEELNEPYHYDDFSDMEEVWTKFQGYFVDDMKQGEGKLHFVNGEYYEGHFDADSINGEGVFHTLDGDTIQGIWKDNILVQTLN